MSGRRRGCPAANADVRPPTRMPCCRHGCPAADADVADVRPSTWMSGCRCGCPAADADVWPPTWLPCCRQIVRNCTNLVRNYLTGRLDLHEFGKGLPHRKAGSAQNCSKLYELGRELHYRKAGSAQIWKGITLQESWIQKSYEMVRIWQGIALQEGWIHANAVTGGKRP